MLFNTRGKHHRSGIYEVGVSDKVPIDMLFNTGGKHHWSGIYEVGVSDKVPIDMLFNTGGKHHRCRQAVQLGYKFQPCLFTVVDFITEAD